jgi:hypothetical protein
MSEEVANERRKKYRSAFVPENCLDFGQLKSSIVGASLVNTLIGNAGQAFFSNGFSYGSYNMRKHTEKPCGSKVRVTSDT